MTSRVVLVTGAAGFIGGYVAEAFAREGDMVIGVDSSQPAAVADRPLAQYAAMSLPNPALIALLKEARPSVVVHCAGRASVPHSMTDPADDFTTNTAMTFAVLEALRQHSPESHFIFPSSAAVYGDPLELPITELATPAPISPYGFHKLQAEQLCREYAEVHGMRTTILRLFSAYGPGQRRQVIWDICRKALTEPSLILYGTGRESRDFIHVRDIAESVVLLAEAEGTLAPRTLNVASGIETSIADLADMVLAALGLDQEVTFDAGDTPGMPSNWRADITATQALGFTPHVDFEEGVNEFAQWARSQLQDR